MIIFAIEILVCSRKDLSIFIKLISFGSFFIITLILFIVGVGIYGFANTKYEASLSFKPNVMESDTRYLYLFGENFSTLAGMLGIGYFLHTVSIPIMKNNKNQQNNERDLSIAYGCVALTYITVGVLGYIGFTGVFFNDYYRDNDTQNID